MVSPCSKVEQEAAPVFSVDANESSVIVSPEACAVEEGAAAALAADAFECRPAVDHVDAGEGGVDAVGASPLPQTGTDGAPPQPWLLKAQARSGLQEMPEGFSKHHESQPTAE